MDDKLKFAAVLLGGYLLGRTKRMKLALTAAGALAVRELRSNPELLKAGSSVLSSPPVKRLTDELSGRLVEAGKAAVVSAATKRVDGLVADLEKRTGSLRVPQDDQEKDEQENDEQADAPEEAEEGSRAEDEPAEDEPAEDEPAATPPRRRRAASSRDTGSARAGASGRSKKAGSEAGDQKPERARSTGAKKPSGRTSARRSGSR